MSKDSDDREVPETVLDSTKAETTSTEPVKTVNESELISRIVKAEKKIKILSVVGGLAILAILLIGAIGLGARVGDHDSRAEARFGERDGTSKMFQRGVNSRRGIRGQNGVDQRMPQKDSGPSTDTLNNSTDSLNN